MLLFRRKWHIVHNILATQRHCSSKCTLDSVPILEKEVLQYLNPRNNQTILDMTFGCGLHAESILKASSSSTLIALDRDPYSFEEAKQLVEKYPHRIIPLLGCFSDLPQLLEDIKIGAGTLDSILLDVGCSDFQLAQESRGFNTNVNGPLDMRMDCSRILNSVTAADVLARCDERDLHQIFKVYGGLDASKKLARAVVACRYQFRPLDTMFEFKDLVSEVLNERVRMKNICYALRAFVNNEINELNFGLLLAQKYLKKGGHIVILTHNQIEDLIVKRHITGLLFENSPAPMNLKYYSHALNLTPNEIETWKKSSWASLTKHVITPKSEVLGQKSQVKLRAAVKLG